MDQGVYERVKDEADMWLSMGQGIIFQGMESYPELFESFPGVHDIADSFFSDHLNPFGDKFVHLGAFYGGSKFTMKGMDYLLDEPSDEALIAGAFLATTAVGGGIEVLDNYFDMADMAADYAGWYLATENYLDEGPSQKLKQFIQDYGAEEYIEMEPDEESLVKDMEYLGKV